MARKSDSLRKDRIAKARARIASGQYDAPGVLDAILSERLLDRVLVDLNRCPVGDGHSYRDLVSECLSACLGEVVDVPMSRTEFPAGGGRGDIELPLRTEALQEHALWDRWERRYDIRSIIVETKNEKKQANVEDVSQLDGYLNRTGFGRFGVLVARMGFSSKAIESMAQAATKGRSLIIPFDHDLLHAFAKASKSGLAMEFLRRRETLLLQAL